MAAAQETYDYVIIGAGSAGSVNLGGGGAGGANTGTGGAGGSGVVIVRVG